METSLPQEVLLWKSQGWKHWDFPAVIFLLDQSGLMLLCFSAVVMWQNSTCLATAARRAHGGAGTALGAWEGGMGEGGLRRAALAYVGRLYLAVQEGL